MKLMIVESPAKAKKIAGFLGTGWKVEASLGHVRDLPETDLGVSVEAGFMPTYEIIQGKGNVVKRLSKAMREAEAVYLAMDPDREGEGIAWHLLQVTKLPSSKPVYRVTFNAITEAAVKAAVAAPRKLDEALVEAQQTRRIVDRLVGYLVSPLACKALDGRFSAGRVQSVGLRLVIERERAIQSFQSVPFWELRPHFDADGNTFEAELYRVKGADPPFVKQEAAARLKMLLRRAVFWVAENHESQKRRNPFPPFTTSTLQQAASSQLDLSPETTMALAQQLYEAGFITYMRTDGVSVAPEAQIAAAELITREYGREYLPDEPPTYKTRATNAQEAHECIRPTDLKRRWQDIDGKGAALYRLIWERFVASQMAPAQYSVTGAIIQAGKTHGQPYPLEIRARGRTLSFDGFLRVYKERGEDDDSAEAEPPPLPILEKGQTLTLTEVKVIEGKTKPPSRYTEASLIQDLERRGIGRPSTYASTLSTLRQKGYVTVQRKHLVPTDAGAMLCDYVVAHFPEVFAAEYTAHLENNLDRIAEGQMTRLEFLTRFWTEFQPQLASAVSSSTDHTPKPLLLRPVEG